MTELNFVKKIRLFSTLSFLIPLAALNLCLILFITLGNFKMYYDLPWDEKLTVVEYEEYQKTKENSLNFCPKQTITKRSFKLTNGKIVDYSNDIIMKYGDGYNGIKIKELLFYHSNKKNTRCVKNYIFMNFISSNFNLDYAINTIREKNKSGFGLVKNPYLYGEVSISRTARYFPANLIFKPLVILSAFLLFLYWTNYLRFFNHYIKNEKNLNFSKKFFYFGCFSCLFLFLHATFLGVSFDSKLYEIFRRFIIIAFIISEVSAQILLTVNLTRLSGHLNKYIFPVILKIKVVFAAIVGLITILSFYILIFNDPEDSFKNMLEWNYFSFLLVYYFLSRLLWKPVKP